MLVGGRARILLVDDRRENLIALDAILSSISDTILVPVRSGEQALTELRSDDYAVVLLDVMMPGLDGLGALRALKNDAVTRDIPVVVLSAKGHALTKVEAEQAGAVLFLAKPFSPNQLLGEAQRILGQ